MPQFAELLAEGDAQMLLQWVSDMVPECTWINLALGTVVSVFLYLCHWTLFVPVERVLRLGEAGYGEDAERSKNKIVIDTKLRRKKGNVPPPYPNGWFRLLDSRDLKPGEVKNVDVLGQHLAVYRGESGVVAVLDAYCPHLGANLALGGKVKGDCLECPFHGWTFNGSGKCVEIPYASKVPDLAKTKAWTSMEHNQQILVWFDAEGREPYWHPPQIQPVHDGQWKFSGRSTHVINAHIQEVPENGADTPHLIHLHGPTLLAGTDLRKTRSANGPTYGIISRHGWEASWEPGTEENGDGHIAYLHLKHNITVFGYTCSLMDVTVLGKQIGPGLVTLEFEGWFGKGVFLQAIAPLGPMEQLITHSIWTEKRVPTFIAKFFLVGEAMQVERDVMIWNNKTFADKPLLCSEDKGISRFRRWYKQFYSESSGSISGQENILDW